MVVTKSDNNIGHIAIFHEEILSFALAMFLGKAGSSITCEATGHRRYSRDLSQEG